ncbi:MAG: hypothetical protein WB424_06390, partial [Terracidiphilus sp.]
MAEKTVSGVTVDELFRYVGLLPHEPVRWKTEISEYCAGIYVIALAQKADNCQFCKESVAIAKLDEDKLKAESNHWIPEEVILYIGQTTKQTLAHRLHQFYVHKYGDRSPHRGGQAIHLLNCDCWVYWAP